MKKNYEELELKVIRFASEDVITASGEEECTKVLCRELAIPCLQCDGVCRPVSEICTSLLQPCMDKCAVAK